MKFCSFTLAAATGAFDVFVCAPSGEKSAQSHAITIRHPLVVEKREVPGDYPIWGHVHSGMPLPPGNFPPPIAADLQVLLKLGRLTAPPPTVAGWH